MGEVGNFGWVNTDMGTDIWTERGTDIGTDKQRDRHRDRRADIGADRQTDRSNLVADTLSRVLYLKTEAEAPDVYKEVCYVV